MAPTVTVKPLRLVPFNAQWINHDKIDVHAIYRRPRYTTDEYGDQHKDVDANGQQTWDLTGGLPVRRHNDWLRKGYEYVTLSDRSSLACAARTGTLPPGTTMADFDQHQVGGPWSLRHYMQGQENLVDKNMAELQADVYKYGSAIVEQIRGRDPNFTMPERLRNIPPGGPVPPDAPELPAAPAVVAVATGPDRKKGTAA